MSDCSPWIHFLRRDKPRATDFRRLADDFRRLSLSGVAPDRGRLLLMDLSARAARALHRAVTADVIQGDDWDSFAWPPASTAFQHSDATSQWGDLWPFLANRISSCVTAQTLPENPRLLQPLVKKTVGWLPPECTDRTAFVIPPLDPDGWARQAGNYAVVCDWLADEMGAERPEEDPALSKAIYRLIQTIRDVADRSVWIVKGAASQPFNVRPADDCRSAGILEQRGKMARIKDGQTFVFSTSTGRKPKFIGICEQANRATYGLLMPSSKTMTGDGFYAEGFLTLIRAQSSEIGDIARCLVDVNRLIQGTESARVASLFRALLQAECCQVTYIGIHHDGNSESEDVCYEFMPAAVSERILKPLEAAAADLALEAPSRNSPPAAAVAEPSEAEIEQLLGLRNGNNRDDGDKYDDLHWFRGWGTRLMALLERPGFEPGRFDTIVFRPDKWAREAMIRFGGKWPVIIRQVQDFLDHAERMFAEMCEQLPVAKCLVCKDDEDYFDEQGYRNCRRCGARSRLPDMDSPTVNTARSNAAEAYLRLAEVIITASDAIEAERQSRSTESRRPSGAGDTDGKPATGSAKVKRTRRKKGEVNSAASAAILHLLENPAATQKECARVAEIPESTLSGNARWNEWRAKIGDASRSPKKINRLKHEFDRKTGEWFAVDPDS